MTGKLFKNLKRKREEDLTKPTTSSIRTTTTNTAGSSTTSEGNVNIVFPSADPSISIDPLGKNKTIENNNAKREKLDNVCNTPEDSNSSSSTSSSSSSPSTNSSSTSSVFIIEALKKIIELQNQMNDLNSEFGLSEDEFDDEVSRINGLAKTGYEAEALGFAMCAKETLLFLQKEGVPENSLLYKALKDRLVGKSEIFYK